MNFGIRENKAKEEMSLDDEELNCIHGQLASGGETMAAKRKPVQLAKVFMVRATNFKKLGISPILFFEEDRQRLHFLYNDALVIQVHIANFMVKRVLVDEGSST